MARKRLNVAKKRVLKAATNKNISFVVQAIPELKQELLESAAARKGKTGITEKKIDLQSESTDAQMVTVPFGDFDSSSDDEGFEPPLPVKHTYSRKDPVEELLQDWETDVQPEVSSNMDNSIQIVHIESLYENGKGTGAAASIPEVVLMNAESDHSRGTSEVEKYKLLVEALTKENDSLVAKNINLESQNGKLLNALTSKLLPTPEKPFTDERYLDCETLIQFSHEAGPKDYYFLKYIMMRLFPEGFVGRSVTGRPSNNPSGRPKKVTNPEACSGPESVGRSVTQASNNPSDRPEEDTNPEACSEPEPVGEKPAKIPLDQEKVEWTKRRLYDRRIFLRDDPVAANLCYKTAGRIMTRIIANELRSALIK